MMSCFMKKPLTQLLLIVEWQVRLLQSIYKKKVWLWRNAHIHKCLSPRKGWLGEANVSCILRHRGVQLTLAYSWARQQARVEGGMFLYLLFLHFRSFSSFSAVPFFHLLYYLFYLSSSFLWEMTQNDPKWRVVKPQHNQWPPQSMRSSC